MPFHCWQFSWNTKARDQSYYSWIIFQFTFQMLCNRSVTLWCTRKLKIWDLLVLVHMTCSQYLSTKTCQLPLPLEDTQSSQKEMFLRGKRDYLFNLFSLEWWILTILNCAVVFYLLQESRKKKEASGEIKVAL